MEVLVGVAIGLIGIVAMFQILDNWEARKRTTSGGSDAQVAGSIALFRLEQDIKQAGYGFGAAACDSVTCNSGYVATYMGCTTSAYDGSRPTASWTFPLVPVSITAGAAAGDPVTISVLYGASAMPAFAQTFTSSTATTKKLAVRTGYQRGDLAIVAENASTCRLIEITDDSNADARTIGHVAGSYTNAANSSASSRYNPAAGYAVASSSGTIYGLGERSGPRRNVWSISGNQLVVTDDLHYSDADGDSANDSMQIGENIINLQAEYGLDATTPRDYVVDTWQSTAPTDWSRVVAVRVALLARSQQYEKDAVTTTAPKWSSGSGTATSFTMKNVDGSTDSSPGNDNDWRHYRYRVYQTTIPLRNVIWGTAP